MQAWRLYPLWSLEFNLELGRVRSSRALKPQDNRHYFKLPQDKGEELLTNTTPSNSSIHSLSRSLAHIEALRMKLNSKLGSLERWPECALDISFKTCRRGDNTDQCRCEYYSRNIFFFFSLVPEFPLKHHNSSNQTSGMWQRWHGWASAADREDAGWSDR